jgi:lipoprotein-anchoring transpeptidase ErfK/SrfK
MCNMPNKAGPIVTKIVVSLERQKLLAHENATIVYEFDCATGDSQNPTPRGNFSILPGRKHRKYRSKQYNAQMDYAMFFYKGYAIHMAYAVGVTSYLKWCGVQGIGSHGCVRLSEENARELFDHTPYQTPVQIV